MPPTGKILAEEHSQDSSFPCALEPACPRIARGILESSEQDVPDRDISIVVGVDACAVMDAMRLGALDDEAKPARSANIPVIEHISKTEKKDGVDRDLLRCSDDEIENQADDEHVKQDLEGIAVEACQ